MQIVLALIVLGLLIFVHELGHFLIAKWSGIRVLAFSIGFGPTIVNHKVGETEYRISAIPFGGYVKMSGEDPEEESTDDPRAYISKPVWQRMAVAAAGPVANFLFAFVALWIVFMAGVSRPAYNENTTLGGVAPKSAAARSGLETGDSISALAGKPVESWDELQKRLTRERGNGFSITIIRNGQQRQLHLEPDRAHKGDEGFDPLGGLRPPLPAVIGMISENSPAERSRLQPQDSVIAFNGEPVHSWFQFANAISSFQKGNDSASLRVRRNSKSLTIKVVPEYDSTEQRYLLGIRPASPPTRVVRYSLLSAMSRAGATSWEYATLIFTFLGQLFSRTVPADQLAGPVGIVQIGAAAAEAGVSALIMLAALISVNLAVLNLLPLVITDGGQMLFLIIEGMRGKPVSSDMRARINRIAVALFILLFLYVTWNDLQRMFG
ncbi:MAG: RIP metalloprotease RseP [Chitinivibrionales bacterium]|nr:RIP metalloprotease RseP [Chitinivibrionales bacterium]